MAQYAHYQAGQMDLIEVCDATGAHSQRRACDALAEWMAETAIQQAADDLQAGLALDDPRRPDAAYTANLFLLAIDWLNGVGDEALTFKLCCQELDYRPAQSREALADKLGLKHITIQSIIQPPDWLRTFVQAIPPQNIAAACRAALAAGPERRPRAPVTLPHPITPLMARWARQSRRAS